MAGGGWQAPTERRANAAHGPHQACTTLMIRSVALSTWPWDKEVFTKGSGERARVFTVQKNDEYRCVCLLRNGRPCNRLLGKGIVEDYETVCPKCGATLKLTKSGIQVIQTAKR